MLKTEKIFLAGHQGMVGSAIFRKLESLDYENITIKNRSELDLTSQKDVLHFFNKNSFDHVILAAAKVGGIYANSEYPADFIHDNLTIQTNVISASFKSKIKQLLFLGSSCIYPKHSKQPMSENQLLTGSLEPTNEPYAVAKIAGIKLCESFNRQYDTDFRSVMPTNLYGPNDNFHEKNSHVLPALIRRFHEAKLNNDDKVKVWGSGLPKREFLHVDDMADACIYIMKIEKESFTHGMNPMNSHVNIGTGSDISIKDLATVIKKVVGFNGEIEFDSSYPDGTMEKLLDVTELNKMGWKYSINLEEGIASTYSWFLNNPIRT